MQLNVLSLDPYYYDPNTRQTHKTPVNQSVNVASKSTPGKIINKVEMSSQSNTVKSKSEGAVKIPLHKSLRYAQSSKCYANWVLNEF